MAQQPYYMVIYREKSGNQYTFPLAASCVNYVMLHLLQSSFFFPLLFSTLCLTRLNYTTAPSVFEAPLLTLGGVARNALKNQLLLLSSLLLLYWCLLGKGNCSTLVALCLKYSVKTTICSLTQVTKHAENERAHSGLWSCQAVAMCVSQDHIYERVPSSQACKRFKNMKFSERIKRITYLLAL